MKKFFIPLNYVPSFLFYNALTMKYNTINHTRKRKGREAMEFLEGLGRTTIDIFRQFGAVVLLLFAAMKKMHRLSLRMTAYQCLTLGVRSLPIVVLTLLFTGMVLSFQIASELVKYGADFSVGGIVAIGMGRELGPVLCGVVLAGRVGAAITAEIGTMRVTEQIDALRCMAVDPVAYLVVPRIAACMAMLPLLNVFGVTIGIAGGMLVASLSANVSAYTFWNSIEMFCLPSDIYMGMVKSVIFGMIVALVGCDRGMTAEAGAEGVGKATTQSVVYSIIMLFAANYFLSSILF